MITKLTSVVNRIWSKFSMKYGAISMKKADILFMSEVKHPVFRTDALKNQKNES